MNTEIAKTPTKPTGRKYTSVAAFMGGESVSQEVQAKVAELRAETTVTLKLAQLRQIAGLTQEDMAKHLNVTQSAISKLESGLDEELTLREIREYARVTGQRIGVMFGKPLTHVEAIKIHAAGLKLNLEALAEIANQGDELEKQIKGFFGEAWFNLFIILASCTGKLPPGDDDAGVGIQLIKALGIPDPTIRSTPGRSRALPQRA